MGTSERNWGWQLGLVSFVAMGGAIAISWDCARSQIIPDGTLPNNSMVTPQGNTSKISGGSQAGSNLFHSFEQFSIPTKSTAYFNNALDIQNIISRVTGSSISNIDGLLRANGTANLFVLNPNGIIFGPNASLNIGGSFLGSTASSINFADGTSFSATAHPTTPLLTVSVPIGLQFRRNSGKILVRGDGEGLRSDDEPIIDTTVGLRVQPNQTLALVGGNVALSGATLKTAGGRIELGSVAGSGRVSLTPIDKGLVLGYDGVQNLGDIKLSGAAAVDASGAGGGDIQVRGRRVTLQDGSQIEASTLGSEPGGTLAVRAKESVEAIGESADGQFVSGLFTSVYEGATGAGGNLTVESGRLIIRDGAEVSADTLGAGPAGTLVVRAKESVEVIGTTADGQFPSALYTTVYEGATAAGGNLTVETGRLIVRDGAEIGSGTLSEGQGGNLAVTASDSVELWGTDADGFPNALFTDTLGAGDAGRLTISTGRLIIRDGGQVSSAAFAEGAGGSLVVNASESVELMGTSPIAQSGSDYSNYFVVDGQLPSGLFTQTNGAGAAGNLRIETGQLSVGHGARVSVSSEGSGNAGNLEATARFIRLENHGKLTAETASGNGGNITLRSQNLLLLRRSSDISTTAGNAGAGGNGGNITIDTPFIVAVPEENSDITANAFTGSGGRAQITSQGVFGLERRSVLTPLSDITAFSQQNSELNGVVEINTPDVDPNRGLNANPAQLVDASRLIASGCGASRRQGSSKFIVTKRGGLPMRPGDALVSRYPTGTVRSIPSSRPSSETPLSSVEGSERSTNPITTAPTQIVEALLLGD